MCPPGNAPSVRGKSGTGNAHAATGPATTSATHTADPGSAAHHLARRGLRPERRARHPASANAPATAAAPTTDANCQRGPVRASTATEPTSSAPEPSAAGPRHRRGSQRARTRTRAPSTVRASGADSVAPVDTVIRPSSDPVTARHIALTSRPCAT
ncbi:hypothetical protein SCALM49S_08109 [Streptomyces californicus]